MVLIIVDIYKRLLLCILYNKFLPTIMFACMYRGICLHFFFSLYVQSLQFSPACSRGYIYYSDNAQNQILRIDFNGHNKQVIVDSSIDAVGENILNFLCTDISILDYIKYAPSIQCH